MKLEALHLLPDDDSPGSVRMYRIRVGLIACSAWIVLAFFVIPAMITGVPKLGQLAWAGEVDKKIEDAMLPLREDNEATNQNLKALTEQTKINQSFLIEGQLHAAQRAWCESDKKGQRAPIAAQRIDELKKQYKKLTGEHPYIPTCQQV
jgi:hypothetical protein